MYMPKIEVNGTALTYLPDTLAAAGKVKNEVSNAAFNFTQGAHDRPWIGTAPGASAGCTNCAQQTLKFTRQIAIQPALSFTTYPFDEQHFQILFELGPDVNVFSCESLLRDDASWLAQLSRKKALNLMLPATNEYQLRDGSSSVTASHPRNANGQAIVGSCMLTFEVKRDASIVFLKVIIPTIIIVYVGLMSVFLSADDHSGDRAALLGVSILICMINLERDHGLGKLMYSTWFDVFNLLQLGIQIIALGEGLLEHKLIKWNREDEALMLQRVCSTD
uniref:Neurotransmitter-gated ion-channel ligand-binding domain-containing protein n=1 Tax=Haptolina brevifila TaxID=156173 RepID=A0A7S2FXH4_9EUKA